MSTNSKSLLLLLLVTLQTVLSTGHFTARTTLLIAGHSSNNIYKYAFAQKFASQVELDRAHSADIVVISADLANSVTEEDRVLLQTLGGIALTGNLTQLVISRLGGDEMSLEHIQVLFQYIDTDEPMIVVEIGEQSVQMRALLNKGALCWGEARANIISPNKAYLCNDVSPETVKKIANIESIHPMEEGTRLEVYEPQSRPFWPCLFASAAKTEKRHRRKQAQEEIEVDDDVEEIVDQIIENIRETPAKQHKLEMPTDKKLGCKYRKSCYESGKVPDIEESDWDWLNFDSIGRLFSFGGKEEQGDDHEEKENAEDGEEEDLTPKKLKCKYRLDCYKEKGIKLTGKDEEREERKSLLAGKTAPQQGKKRSLKEIAERTVKKVKVAEEKAAARPLPTSVIAERKLSEIEEKLTEKLQCKYRKSCYETGELPVIETTWSFPAFSTHTAEEATEEVDFHEMEELERKMFCKYRKSCYETGVKPEIEPDIQIHSFSDLRDLPDVIETRKMTVQGKCKYRKSCYETGILPEINPQLEKVIQKEVSSVIPTNVDELKKFCKYRKSCYEEIAQSASVETVKNIRKRRLIEKEVRRRKARRARMRRRLHGVELDPIGGTRGLKHKRYAVRQESEEVEEKVKPVPEPKVKKERKVKAVPVVEEKSETPSPVEPKQSKKRSKPAEEAPKVAEPVKEVTEDTQEVQDAPKPKRKGKKSPEPEPVAEPEEKQKEEPPKSVKKSGKTEEAQVSPVPVEEEPVRPVRSNKKSSKKEESPEPTPMEEPEPVSPKVKTVKKAKREEKEEEKAIPKKKEKNVETGSSEESQLSYDETQKLQSHCKYRKSCYETKERPVIVQTFSTLYDKFDSHVNEHYESLENQELSEADKKLACKYRRSCYETNQRPVIVQTLSSIWGGAEPAVETAEDREEEAKEKHFHNEVERKLYCKYRRSCYDNNRRPIIKVSSIWGESTPVVEKDQDEELEKDHSWHSEEHKKLACKYRRSCYEKHGWHFGHDEENKEEEEEVPVKAKKVEKKEAPKPKEKKQEPAPKVEKVQKKVVKETQKPAPDESEEEEEMEQKENKTEVTPHVGDEHLPHLGRGQKLGCKYRKSCYVNAPPVEVHTRTIRVEGGVPQRVKCNEYYLSCREKLGLPPKEKAPIGPNGKRLCRKKKIDQ